MSESHPSNADVGEPSLAQTGTTAGSGKGSLLAGVLAGLGASACCLGPLVLLSLGISGSWISGLSALEPLRPLFIGISLLFLFLAYRRLYRAPACAPDAPCSSDLRRQRRLFWLASIVIALLIAFPWYGPLILE